MSQLLEQGIEQTFSIAQHQEMRQQIDDVRLAAFLTRASTAAYAVCDGHQSNLTVEALDKLKAERDHWVAEIKTLTI